MILDKVVLLNPTTVRVWIDFSGEKVHFDLSLIQIQGMTATEFRVYATNNFKSPVVNIPEWLITLEGSVL